MKAKNNYNDNLNNNHHQPSSLISTNSPPAFGSPVPMHPHSHAHPTHWLCPLWCSQNPQWGPLTCAGFQSILLPPWSLTTRHSPPRAPRPLLLFSFSRQQVSTCHILCTILLYSFLCVEGNLGGVCGGWKWGCHRRGQQQGHPLQKVTKAP